MYKIIKLQILCSIGLILLLSWRPCEAAYRFAQFQAHPPIHIFSSAATKPSGLTPEIIKKIYHLPETGGKGTIAIIGAYNNSLIENDLGFFSKQFNLPACTIKNGCLEKHKLSAKNIINTNWSIETSLDVEWAHAIAPNAKILLVEAETPSGKNLIKAIDYARKRNDVVAISMSWGGLEFSDEISLDSYFANNNGIVFFASSGDNGSGVSWPAASNKVVAVGGTSLNLGSDKSLISENAWRGSGGGISRYENEPIWQKNYKIRKANGYRAIPDVSYNADPHSGFAVYCSINQSKNNWYVLGGTSAGAPQWAAIQSLGLSANPSRLYSAKAKINSNTYFRDIISGTNGDCGYFCTARAHYDYVTGLGSPLGIHF